MRLTQDQKLRKTIRWLRKRTHDFAVYTRQLPLKDSCGDCSYKNGPSGSYFLIRINKSQIYQAKIDTLIHEWAHALTWFAAVLEDHPTEWGEAYARIYRAWLKWDFGIGEK